MSMKKTCRNAWRNRPTRSSWGLLNLPLQLSPRVLEKFLAGCCLLEKVGQRDVWWEKSVRAESHGNDAGTSGPDGSSASDAVEASCLRSVVSTRTSSTAVKCPCGCGVLVKVDRHGASGPGKAKCPHCDLGADRATWGSAAEFTRHVLTSGDCVKRRTKQDVERNSQKSALGEVICENINLLKNRKMVDGKKFFVCYMKECGKLIRYEDKFRHARLCFEKNGVRLGDYSVS